MTGPRSTTSCPSPRKKSVRIFFSSNPAWSEAKYTFILFCSRDFNMPQEGMGVPHFVVVPRKHLDQVADDARHREVGDARVGGADDVGGDELLVGDGKDALPPRRERGGGQDAVYFLRGSFAPRDKRDVNQRAGDHRHAQGDAVELSRQVRIRFGYRNSRSGGGWR